jgi:hypothetical protein
MSDLLDDEDMHDRCHFQMCIDDDPYDDHHEAHFDDWSDGGDDIDDFDDDFHGVDDTLRPLSYISMNGAPLYIDVFTGDISTPEGRKIV